MQRSWEMPGFIADAGQRNAAGCLEKLLACSDFVLRRHGAGSENFFAIQLIDQPLGLGRRCGLLVQ